MMEHDAEKRSAASLTRRLRERIKSFGPISFSEWMKAALYDEREGYYCRSDLKRWGREGDYRTSPERSRLFAATFARYFAQLYHELGSPQEFTILEAGAGAGHFAHDVLETLKRFHQHVFHATRYLIDEASTDARARAKSLLAPFKERVAFLQPENLEKRIGTGIIFSNELLDAMPVHRVLVKNGKLLELCVGLDEADEFIWIETEPTTLLLEKYFFELGVRPAEGYYAEVNLAAADWLCRASASLLKGYIITVDYGAHAAQLYQNNHRRTGTLRAFRQHRFADNPLDSPGAQDITSTVNWTHIQHAGQKCGLETLSLERQDTFLLRAGLLEQLELLTAASASEAETIILRTSAREMILPGSMSSSFQVLIQKRI
jgi:Uncharacterized conserved protein